MKEVTHWKVHERELAEKNYLSYNMQVGTGELEDLKAKRLRV